MLQQRSGNSCSRHDVPLVRNRATGAFVCPRCVGLAREKVRVEIWRHAMTPGRGRHRLGGFGKRPSALWFLNWPRFARG